MSRIDIVKGDKKTEVKILINFIQRGAVYHSTEFAMAEAQRLAPAENVKLEDIHNHLE